MELKARTEALFGTGWTPEVDTFDTFIDSSWYFLRYTDPHNDAAFADKAKLAQWLPIDRYSGGAEHTTMHVLYSRFWHKALFDLGFVPQDEPYKVRMNRGQILGPDGKKMSKSKGNVVDPDEHVERVGADTVRLYLAFMGPYNVPGNYPFDLGGVAGMRRFLERIVRLGEKLSRGDAVAAPDPAVTRLLHQTIKKVGEDCDAYKFNTAISQLMIFVNLLEKQSSLAPEHYATLLKLLAPFAPHLTEELWERGGEEGSIHLSPWPEYDESLCVEDEVTYAIQINGKVRATMTATREALQDELESRAKELQTVNKWLNGELKRTIFVPTKIINFIIVEKRE
jgi:leucyl-tRNA synthetase